MVNTTRVYRAQVKMTSKAQMKDWPVSEGVNLRRSMGVDST